MTKDKFILGTGVMGFFLVVGFWSSVISLSGCGRVVDTVIPYIVSTFPTHEAAGILVSTAVTATFSEDMDPSTITTATFTLVSSTGATVSGAVTYASNVATFTPSATLEVSSTYIAMVSADVKDLEGDKLASPKTWSFTTSALSSLPSAPTLIRPADDALTLDTTPAFDWEDVSGVSTYQIQIDNNANFDSPAETATPGVSNYTSSGLSRGTYYWRVRAGDGLNWGNWSVTRKLVIGKLTGDVNGDGYADVIVGVPLADAGGTDRGQAYIYYGGTSMDNTPDVTLSGGADNDMFGFPVSLAGDVNGDGYADVIVGAYQADAGGTNRGQAYIYYGGASMDNTADVTLSGGADSDQLGRSVSSAGDVNGDGYTDVIVGADLADAGGASRGEAYIYYGGVSMDNTADVTLSGGADSDYLGTSVSSAGDVNGDGYADVIVGAYGADAGGTNRGQAYIYYGGASMDNTVDVTLSGGADNDYLGMSVSSAGNVNGDGYADVIIGAVGADAGGTDRGQAYIRYGAPTGSAGTVTLSGGADNDYLGFSVSSAGDINADGYADVIAGAYGADAGGVSRGQAYIYYGEAAGMDSTADVTMSGAANSDYLGASVSGNK